MASPCRPRWRVWPSRSSSRAPCSYVQPRCYIRPFQETRFRLEADEWAEDKSSLRSFGSGPKAGRWRAAIAEFGQCRRTHELQALHRVVAVDLLHIELAHEVDGFLGDHLTGYHDWKAGRIGDDKTRRDQIRTVLQTAVDFGIVQAEILASR